MKSLQKVLLILFLLWGFGYLADWAVKEQSHRERARMLRNSEQSDEPVK